MKYAYAGDHAYEADLATQARVLRDDLRGLAADYARRLGEIRVDRSLSTLEKEHQEIVLRREAPPKALAAARKLWEHFEPAFNLIDAAIRRAYRNPPALDYAGLEYLVKEYQGRLAAPTDAGLGGEHRLAQIKRLRAQAIEAGDQHALRALRLASQNYLDRPDGDPRFVQRRTDLLKAFAQDEEAEVPQDVRLLQQERSELQRLQREADATIDTAEVTFYGDEGRRDVFRPLTQWDKEIRGRTLESVGSIVWSPQAREAAARFAAEHPKGIQGKGPSGADIFTPEWAAAHGGGVLFDPKVNPKQRPGYGEKSGLWD